MVRELLFVAFEGDFSFAPFHFERGVDIKALGKTA
jgi:hypothetical protein